MKKLVYQIPLIALIALSGCRKDLPLPPNDVTAEFYAKATVDGVEVLTEAGIDDYYMYTTFEVGDDNVEHYVGRLSKTNESTEAWTIKFRGTKGGGQSSVDSVLALGEQSLTATMGRIEDEDHVKVTLFPEFVSDVYPQLLWSVLPVGGASGASSQFTWDSTNYSQQPIVRLEAQFGNVCDAVTYRCVNLRNPEYKASWYIEAISSTRFRVYVDPADTAGLKEVYWTKNNQSWGSGFERYYDLSSPSEHIMIQAAFQHKGSNLGSCLIREFVLTAGVPDPCTIDFSYLVEAEYELDSLQYNSLEISYTDENGRIYSTSYHAEPGDVLIEEIDDYLSDEDGRPTKKVRLTGDFLLSDATGDEIRVENAEFVLAVATRDP